MSRMSLANVSRPVTHNFNETQSRKILYFSEDFPNPDYNEFNKIVGLTSISIIERSRWEMSYRKNDVFV